MQIQGLSVPVLEVHLVEGDHAPAELARLLEAASRRYAEVLESPLERIRAHATLHAREHWAVAARRAARPRRTSPRSSSRAGRSSSATACSPSLPTCSSTSSARPARGCGADHPGPARRLGHRRRARLRRAAGRDRRTREMTGRERGARTPARARPRSRVLPPKEVAGGLRRAVVRRRRGRSRDRGPRAARHRRLPDRPGRGVRRAAGARSPGVPGARRGRRGSPLRVLARLRSAAARRGDPGRRVAGSRAPAARRGRARLPRTGLPAGAGRDRAAGRGRSRGGARHVRAGRRDR